MKRDLVLLFDVDGVIADVPHEEAWRSASLEWKLFPENFDFKKFYQMNIAGLPGLKGAENILKEYYSTNRINEFAEREKIAKKFRERKQKFLESYLSEGKFKIFNDVVSIIKEAKENGIPIAAVSSSENAEKILREANLYDIFDSTTLGAIKHRTLKKEFLYSFSFGRLCEKIGATNVPYPIVFEDADMGVVAAKNLGYFCVGIARENLTNKELLLKKGADIAYNESDLQKKDYRRVIEEIKELIEIKKNAT